MRFTRKRLAVLGGAVVLTAAALPYRWRFGATFPGTLSITDPIADDRLFRDGLREQLLPEPGVNPNPGLIGDGHIARTATRARSSTEPHRRRSACMSS